MGWLLRRCQKCHSYTLATDTCPHCGGKVHIPHPAKFSPDDKYATHRVAMKKKAPKYENHDQRKTAS